MSKELKPKYKMDVSQAENMNREIEIMKKNKISRKIQSWKWKIHYKVSAADVLYKKYPRSILQARIKRTMVSNLNTHEELMSMVPNVHCSIIHNS